jgi:hypothetical protein
MGMPQVPDRSKPAPTFGLRAVFAGIGRLLLLADRPESGLTGTGVAPGPADPRHQSSGRRTVRPGRGVAQPTSRWRSLDKTGNVRLLSAEDLDEEFDDDDFLENELLGDSVMGQVVTVDEILEAELPDVELPEKELPAAADAALAAPALPLAGYDELSLASIRARLRNLDVSQLRILADHERRNAERPEVLGMLERRIEKLGADG